MARGELIKKLFASFGREDEFKAIAKQIIEEEEKKNNKVLAKSLRRTLDEAGAGKGGALRPLQPVHAATSTATDALYDTIDPTRRLSEIVLSTSTRDVVTGVIEEIRRAEELRRHALPVKRRLLFCGPPGCGKSICAEVIAREVGLPLIVARLDGLVSSYLGETAANLRKLFEIVTARPVVLFLDEFDALAGSRLDRSDHGEVRRVVNALLLMMDHFPDQGMLIAATNLEATLDSALWRRFDDITNFDKPDLHSINEMLAMKFKNFKTNFALDKKAEKLAGMSFAEIERLSFEAIKRAVLKKQKSVSERDFEGALRDERRRLSLMASGREGAYRG